MGVDDSNTLEAGRTTYHKEARFLNHHMEQIHLLTKFMLLVSHWGKQNKNLYGVWIFIFVIHLFLWSYLLQLMFSNI